MNQSACSARGTRSGRTVFHTQTHTGPFLMVHVENSNVFWKLIADIEYGPITGAAHQWGNSLNWIPVSVCDPMDITPVLYHAPLVLLLSDKRVYHRSKRAENTHFALWCMRGGCVPINKLIFSAACILWPGEKSNWWENQFISFVRLSSACKGVVEMSLFVKYAFIFSSMGSSWCFKPHLYLLSAYFFFFFLK